MDRARLFGTETIVLAQEVSRGKYSKDENYVDLEEDFRVVFVKAARNNGRPYFRFYLAREDYYKMSDEQKKRYEILCEQRHYQESPWHRYWEGRFKPFSELEKTIKNNSSGKRKRADAFYPKTNTCIEFQHSFIDRDFEERNAFYAELKINTIWLYDLSNSIVKPMDDGGFEILENNAKGFFRVAENPDNLKNNMVFIQTRDKKIYRVNELGRKQIDSDLKSTIRFFYPVEVLNEEEFIDKVKNDYYSPKEENVSHEPTSLYELWNPKYYQMVVKNTENNDTILIHKDQFKMWEMQKDFDNPTLILYRYVDLIGMSYRFKSNKRYRLTDKKAGSKKWQLIRGFIDEGNNNNT